VLDGVEQTQAPLKLSLLDRVQHFRVLVADDDGQPAVTGH
jgi:hypothetical protein